MTRIVAVSNRVTPPRRAAAAGGLAVGVAAAMKSRGGMWFGWSGEVGNAEPAAASLDRKQEVVYATIDLPRADFQLYYDGFCNDTLWPLFHYFLGSMQYSEPQYAAYQRVNQLFADRLQPLLQDGDLVWVHDYHLIPLARELRARGWRQPIGFFLHIPFPHIEALRTLPVYEDLVRELLAYDLLGFQTARDLDCFRSAVRQVAGAAAVQPDGTLRSGRHVTRADVFPIGVDVAAIRQEARSSRSTETVRRMRDGLLGRQCIIGVDRLDYSKGLVERFQAYERLLELHPESLNRVTFIQVAPLSRANLRAYAGIRRSLEQMAGRINGRFAETDWTPIRYLNRNFSHEVLMGFLRNARVGVATPMRDGMNLVAKEYVAAQDPEDPGALVLSRLAGAAEELTDALLVNPHDVQAVAQAIHQALSMPLDERRARHARMLEVLERNGIDSWHRRFIEQLEACAAGPGPAAAPRRQRSVRAGR